MDDYTQLDGPRFMRLAWRLSAYEGVMSMRLRAQDGPATAAPGGQAPAPARTQAAPPPGQYRPPVPRGAQVVEAAAFYFDNADMIEKGSSAG